MEALFRTILNMSGTGAVVICAVLLLRLLLKRAPKRYSYWLWSAALFRLVCPVSWKSVFSIFALLPMTSATVPTVSVGESATSIEYFAPAVDAVQTPAAVLPLPAAGETGSR